MNGTKITVAWLSHMNYWHILEKMDSIEDIKRWVMAKLGDLSSNQVKGLRQTNWDQIYQLSRAEII